MTMLSHVQGRSQTKPIAICVADIAEVYSWARVTVSRSLIEDLLPGQVQYSTVQNRTEQYSITVQYSAEQYSTVLSLNVVYRWMIITVPR